MNHHPYCPWCRGPVQRTARHRWTCAPCVALYETAQRDGVLPPWGNNPWKQSFDLPEGEQGFDGTLQPWAIHSQIEDFDHMRMRRNFERDKKRERRHDAQIRAAIDRGLEPLLDRFARTNQRWDRGLVHRVAAIDLNTQAAESLLLYRQYEVLDDPSNEDDGEFFTVREFWNAAPNATSERIRDYVTSVLSHRLRSVVLNDDDEDDKQDDADNDFEDDFDMWGSIAWIRHFYNMIQPGTSDEAIDEIYHAFLRAGAILDVNNACWRCHANRWPDEWRAHVHERLSTLALQTLDEHIAAGYDLRLLFGRSFRIPAAIKKLTDAGLSFGEIGPNAFISVIKHDPERALDLLEKGLPRQVIDPVDGGPLNAAMSKMLNAWRSLKTYGEAYRERYHAHRAIVLALLDAGVNVNAVKDGDLPAAAAALDHDHVEMFHLLHRHGARIEPCIEYVQGVLAKDHSTYLARKTTCQRYLAMLLGIQQDELRAAMADAEPPVQRSAPRRRL
ncbi:hypothetical protein [Burkholderia gladioli]|uniref:hypothetical protein n=1 Tax=Burkholderia gladioli TaxID=28095 RepID=UPI0016421169|nr:hypothetical protein [Burkholderia gladioli]